MIDQFVRTMMARAVQANPQSLSYVTGTVANDTTSITIPDVLDGDLLVLWDSCVQTASITAVTPAGWTSLSTRQDAAGTSLYHRACISYVIASASMSGTVVNGISGSAGTVGKVLEVYRPSSAISSVVLVDPDGVLTANDPAPQTITSGSSTAAASIAYGLFRCYTGQPATPSMSPTESQAYHIGGFLDLLTHLYGDGEQEDATVDTGDSGTYNGVQSGYIDVLTG